RAEASPRRGWRAFIAPFFGGVAIFGCAFLAYTLLHSPDGSTRAKTGTPSSKPRPDPARPPASGQANPQASGSATAGPPPAPEGMVYIAAATFRMGDGKNAREVTLTRGYFLDRDEVSVRQYGACVTKRLCASASRVTLAPATAPDDDGEDRSADSP